MGRWIRVFLAALASLLPSVSAAQEAGLVPHSGGADNLWAWLLEAVLFGGVGIVILIGAYYLWELITPYSVKEQLIRQKNVAVAIVVAAFILGTAIVIAAAITPA